MNLQIAPMQTEMIAAVKKFTDEQIGHGYYSPEKIAGILQRSQGCSFVLIDENGTIWGVRLTFPPGAWLDLPRIGECIAPEAWPCGKEEAGYFQSLFLHPQVQKQGWGGRMSEASLKALKGLGARAVVCHSWKESPGNSSQKYLLKMGFKAVKEYENFWKPVDYTCTRCGKPCLCTAVEMVKPLEDK